MTLCFESNLMVSWHWTAARRDCHFDNPPLAIRAGCLVHDATFVDAGRLKRHVACSAITHDVTRESLNTIGVDYSDRKPRDELSANPFPTTDFGR